MTDRPQTLAEMEQSGHHSTIDGRNCHRPVTDSQFAYRKATRAAPATMPRPTGPAVAMAAPPVEVEVEAPAEELEAESEVSDSEAELVLEEVPVVLEEPEVSVPVAEESLAVLLEAVDKVL
jgi:hypothetical protein